MVRKGQVKEGRGKGEGEGHVGADRVPVRLESFDARLANGDHLCIRSYTPKGHKGLLVCKGLAQQLDAGPGISTLKVALGYQAICQQEQQFGAEGDSLGRLI